MATTPPDTIPAVALLTGKFREADVVDWERTVALIVFCGLGVVLIQNMKASSLLEPTRDNGRWVSSPTLFVLAFAYGTAAILIAGIFYFLNVARRLDLSGDWAGTLAFLLMLMFFALAAKLVFTGLTQRFSWDDVEVSVSRPLSKMRQFQWSQLQSVSGGQIFGGTRLDFGSGGRMSVGGSTRGATQLISDAKVHLAANVLA